MFKMLKKANDIIPKFTRQETEGKGYLVWNGTPKIYSIYYIDISSEAWDNKLFTVFYIAEIC